jgi:hypothetical protein
VHFSHGVTTHMMAIDGTWRRSCIMEDVSSTGAKLTVEGSIEGLKLTEFFLVLSSTGLAYLPPLRARLDQRRPAWRLLHETDQQGQNHSQFVTAPRQRVG